jgi:hypothetical protein
LECNLLKSEFLTIFHGIEPHVKKDGAMHVFSKKNVRTVLNFNTLQELTGASHKAIPFLHVHKLQYIIAMYEKKCDDRVIKKRKFERDRVQRKI